MSIPKYGYDYTQTWKNVDMTYPNVDINIPKCEYVYTQMWICQYPNADKCGYRCS